MLPPVISAVFCDAAMLAAIQSDTTTLALAMLLCKSAGVTAPSTSLTVSTTLPTRPATLSTGCTGVPDVVNVAMLPTMALASEVIVSVTLLSPCSLDPPSALPQITTVLPTAYPEPLCTMVAEYSFTKRVTVNLAPVPALDVVLATLT